MGVSIMEALRRVTRSIAARIPNGLSVIDNKLYLSRDEVPISEGIEYNPGSGGSGGSVGFVTLVNKLPSTNITAAIGQSVSLVFTYASSEDGDSGTAYVYVDDVVKSTVDIIRGENTINVESFLKEGINTVRLKCMDQYGNYRNLSYTVTIVPLRISSTFDATVAYDGDISYTYVPTGSVNKFVHFILDGSEIDTVEVSISGKQQTYVIPRQPHGSHTFEVYFTAEINGDVVPSNHLYYDLICIKSGETTPIICCAYNSYEIVQFDTMIIPYVVYSPVSLTSDIILSANGKQVNELVVDRTQQIWTFRANEAGALSLSISCGEITKTINIDVIKSSIDVSATTDSLELYLASQGRSNNELNPAVWEYGDVSATFSNFNFTSDGWQLDDDGATVLRVAGDARLEIPAKIFANDFRSTGKTIEIEFSSSEVLDYEAVIMSCMSGGRGIQVTAQRADLFSEQSAIGTQYKENEHIRISFVIEKKSENLFLLIYLNGILSGAEVYPADDDFTQVNPVGISIGSNYCTTDIYCIRVYNNSLTRYQILDNWIADTQNGSMMIERYNRNQVYNDYGDITISNLPVDLPYLVIEASALPQFKDDKKTCAGYYVDLLNPDNNFSFENAQIDVQGTSSQYYYVKNYKIKFKGGFKNDNGVASDNYRINNNAVPTNVFTFKADVASSEGANNVVLAQIYNDLCPTVTPPQQENPNVRQTIDGHPIVIFWNNGTEVKFLGKYNFNNDKGTAEVFGFVDGDESWEIRQNGTDRVGWKSDDFSDGSGWENDFEARYPEDNTNTTNLKALATWLVSTNTEAATNAVLPSAVTYDDVEYTIDSVEYRLAKFRSELPDHVDVENIIFYYLITEIFLCIDQREKNAFPTLFGDMGTWIMFFYDADSTIGIDNKGKLAFSPYLEDIDYTEGGDPVYNGQGSVLWVNLRKTYYNEIAAMYQQLRIDDKISYDIVDSLFEKHQNKWCEAIFNEDMYRKCLEPMVKDADGQYLPMLLGKKELHRKWWLYNRFRFLDSKYVTGNSMETRIMIRAKSKANVTLIPYVNMYGHVYYNSEMVEHRMERNKEYEFVWAASGAEDAVIGINDADMLTSIGDLAPLQVETIDISLASHLTSLKIGDASDGYSNKSLTAVTLGNNVLLRSLDLRNCQSLNVSVNASGCTNIEEVYCDGTSITGINLPNGGILKTLHLPDTITNLTICNQPFLTEFVLNDSSNVSTLRLENVGSSIDALQVVTAMADGGRVRTTDINWFVSSEDELVTLFEKLTRMRGLDEYGNNIEKAIVSGRCRVGEKVSDSVVGEIYSNFPDVIIDDGSTDIYIVNYKDWDGSILYTDRLAEGENAINPIEKGYISAPFRESDEYYSYEFVGWNMIPTNVNKHYQVIAQYHTKVAVNFCVDGEIIHSEYVVYGEDAEDPVVNGTIEIPIKDGTDDLHYAFNGWDKSLTNITMPRNINALWVNVYPVRFYATESSTTPHYVQWVKENEDAYDPIAANECAAPSDIVTEDITYVFSNWDSIPTNVVAITNVYAEYSPFWAVRFYNGYLLEDTQWIPTGGSAVDPVTSGRIVTPVRASTAQYDYTFSGWEGNYTNVTEARKIMANYTATIRKYSVYFYNGDELLQTVENVSYGTQNVSYTGSTPVKTGVDNPEEYVFKGWMPAPENIVGETECYALFKFTGYLFGKLGADSEYGTVDEPNWDKINSYWTVIDADIASYKGGSMSADDFNTKYQIGGRMIIPIELSDGTSTVADVEIIGHNHDDLADNSGKATLTFFCKDLPDLVRSMNERSGDEGGWEYSAMRTFMNGELYSSLPSDLKTAIVQVTKISDAGSNDKRLVTTTDYCWAASYDEVGFTNDNKNLAGQGQLYDSIFSTNKATRKKYIIDNTDTGGWWLRSSNYSSAHSLFWRVQKSGASYGDIPTGKFYVAFGFCI